MTTRINEAALIQRLCRPGGPVETDIARRSLRVRNQAVLYCTNQMVNIRTGRLASSITWSIERIGGIPVGVIGTNVEYAKYVHNGTGLYGPHGRAIVRASRKRGGYPMVNKGIRPRPFLTKALEAANG